MIIYVPLPNVPLPPSSLPLKAELKNGMQIHLCADTTEIFPDLLYVSLPGSLSLIWLCLNFGDVPPLRICGVIVQYSLITDLPHVL